MVFDILSDVLKPPCHTILSVLVYVLQNIEFINAPSIYLPKYIEIVNSTWEILCYSKTGHNIHKFFDHIHNGTAAAAAPSEIGRKQQFIINFNSHICHYSWSIEYFVSLGVIITHDNSLHCKTVIYIIQRERRGENSIFRSPKISYFIIIRYVVYYLYVCVN